MHKGVEGYKPFDGGPDIEKLPFRRCRNAYISPHICLEQRQGMAKKKKGEGFHSAAGLIRYFDDEDERSIRINPYFVLAMCIGAAVVVLVASYMWPT